MKCNSCIFRLITKQGNTTKQICKYTGTYIDPVYSCTNWQLGVGKNRRRVKQHRYFKQ